MVTDHDPRFLHTFWQELNRLQGTALAMSTAYHSQTDADARNRWVAMLPWAGYWYNTAFQSSACMTPFKVLYGRDPPAVTRYILGSSPNELVGAYLVDRDKILVLLKANLARAQNRMKGIADKQRKELKAEGIVVTNRADVEDTSYAIVATLTQPESAAVKRSQRVKIPSKR
ncbi:PREDICTED: uncharacterized protein LOC109241636 [Nicotiana attenuata]|uniref:uncharacterized protein LOC109241636 n=1 Tax=Nicotiana attenuata TaxID=49451 RepID=UPI000905B796|nr:PREDICTED: uncharacterized protein LOC109241636 [Nicotiana attenuata]